MSNNLIELVLKIDCGVKSNMHLWKLISSLNRYSSELLDKNSMMLKKVAA